MNRAVDQCAEMPVPKAGGHVRLDRLTSMRLFAALAVFGFHGTVFFSGTTRDALDFIFGQGRSGVTFFFILSGFLLAWSARVGDRISSFYWRRFARVYPVYLVTLAFAAVLWALRDPVELTTGFLTPFLLQAWIPDSAHYFAVNTPAWSLSVEAFFYLAFPFVVIALRRLSSRGLWVAGTMLIATTVAIASYAAPTTPPNELSGNTFEVWFAIYFPVSRLPEFLLGVVLALLMKRGAIPRISWPFAIVLMASTWAVMSVWPSIYNVSAFCAVPFSLLIVSAAQRDVTGVSGWLRAPLMVRGGMISYSFYLVHHILIMRLSQPGFEALGFTGWLAFAITLGASAVGAWLLHKFVEEPMNSKLRQHKSLRFNRASPRASGGEASLS